MQKVARPEPRRCRLVVVGVEVGGRFGAEAVQLLRLLASLALARKAHCPELRQSARCKLVVLALELGGRWSAETATLVRLLARLRSRAAPASSRGPRISAFTACWSALLSFAAARAFAASLFSLPRGGRYSQCRWKTSAAERHPRRVVR